MFSSKKFLQMVFVIVLGLLIIPPENGCQSRYLPTRNYGDNVEKLRELMYQILESSSENQPQQSLPSSLSASSPLFASLSQQHNRNLQWPKMNFGASDVSDSSASHADRSMHTAANDPNARLKFFLKHPQRFMNNLDQLM